MMTIKSECKCMNKPEDSTIGQYDQLNPSHQDEQHRSEILRMTKSWIGTPYHHQQSVKQAGCDCLGLIRGVYREYYGQETTGFHSYSRDWAEVSREETLINAAKDHLIQREIAQTQPADVVIFRFRKWMVAKHAAILSAPDKMIHAIEGSLVEEVHLGSWWRRHIAAVFSFPSFVFHQPEQLEK